MNFNNTRDGHIHSPYCPHGTKDSFKMYIDNAIFRGLTEISFTEHMPLPDNMTLSKKMSNIDFLEECSMTHEATEKYIEELTKVKEEYKDRIKINIGFEVDYVEGFEEKTMETLNKYGDIIEDSILSVHFVKIGEEYFPVDSKNEFDYLVQRLGSIEAVYDLYYNTLLKAIKSDLGEYKPTRIGHPTLVRKFNLEYPIEYSNDKLLNEICKEIRLNNYEIDFNTSGIRKTLCREAYPSGKFRELVKSYDINVVFGSDSHTAIDVGQDFNRKY